MSKIDENINICKNCKTDYYKIKNDNIYDGEYFNCYKEINGYYLDKNDSLFKKCYDSCEICETKGDNNNHNCLKCNTNYSYEINVNNYTNCYKNCSYYHYFDNENYYHCTINLSCPFEYPILIQEKMECINDTIKYSSNVIQTSEFEISNETKIINEYYSFFDSSEIIEKCKLNIFNDSENVNIYEYKSTQLELSDINEIIKEQIIKIEKNIKNIIQNIIKEKNKTEEVTKEEEIKY